MRGEQYFDDRRILPIILDEIEIACGDVIGNTSVKSC